MKRINIGCGQTPIPGFYNYDNSFSLILAKIPFLEYLFDKLGLISNGQKGFIDFARRNIIFYADANKKLPIPDASVDVLYTSHILEHLDREQIIKFLKEARRVLSKNGIIRISIPDLEKLINNYIVDRNADVFVEHTYLARAFPKSLFSKIKYLVFGDRGHKWMYDGPSMARLLSDNGFKNVKIMPAGSTMIQEPGEFNLYERQDISVYIEAFNSEES